jgi:hypothetical protein
MPQAPIPVDVPDGLGVIDVLGNEAASVLYLSGDPVWLHAYDNHGSVGELAARAGRATPRPQELSVLRDYLADPGLRVDKRTGDPYGLQIEPLRPLLRLLQRGRYLVSARTMTRNLAIHDRHDREWIPWYLGHDGYGPDEVLLATDRWPPRDPGTVAQYRERIKKGARPAAVAVGPFRGTARYLLDGHHKIGGYLQARVRPVVAEIVPTEPHPLPRELFEALLPDSARDEFRDALRYWDPGDPPPDGYPP